MRAEPVFKVMAGISGGLQLFLQSAETLEYVLLPHLAAADLFKLSCTNTAMQQWLLGTPAHLWQVSTAFLLMLLWQHTALLTQPCSLQAMPSADTSCCAECQACSSSLPCIPANHSKGLSCFAQGLGG